MDNVEIIEMAVVSQLKDGIGIRVVKNDSIVFVTIMDMVKKGLLYQHNGYFYLTEALERAV